MDKIIHKMHELKTYPEYFTATQARRKTFEYRKNDRDYHIGDFLILREFDPTRNKYTGFDLAFIITYILHDSSSLPIPEGYCILSIRELLLEEYLSCPKEK